MGKLIVLSIRWFKQLIWPWSHRMGPGRSLEGAPVSYDQNIRPYILFIAMELCLIFDNKGLGESENLFRHPSFMRSVWTQCLMQLKGISVTQMPQKSISVTPGVRLIAYFEKYGILHLISFIILCLEFVKVLWCKIIFLALCGGFKR